MTIPRTWPRRAIPLLVFAALLVYTLDVLHDHYLARSFAYHDMGLINDFLGNTAHGAPPFWIAETGSSHLRMHFTPTLLLLVPFYRTIDSPFLLLAWNAIALYLALWLLFLLSRSAIESGQPNRSWTPLLADLCLPLVLCGNIYCRTVLLSAHYELLYPLFAAATLFALIRGARWPMLLMLWLLALGTRGDAGFFLAFQILCVAFLPAGMLPADRQRLLRRITLLSILSLLFTVAAATWIMPALSTHPASHVQRFWGHLGTTWGQVGLRLAASPLWLTKQIAGSAFLPLNASLGCVTLLNPPIFVLSNLPGTLFYVSSAMDKKLLAYYNSAFLLPGLFLGLAAALHRIDSFARRHRLLRHALPLVLLALTLLTVRTWPATLAGDLAFAPQASTVNPHLRETLSRRLARCAGVRSVATDFRNVVFVPNRYQKLLLRHFRSADAVILSSDGTPFPSGAPEWTHVHERVRESGLFQMVQAEPGYFVYLRKGLSCRNDAWP
jgi:uncharacterized membrane protein